MGDFVITDREYPRLPELLMEEAPGFANSDELRRLDSPDRALPSVVCGAFTRYVERLHATARVSGGAEDVPLADTFRAIERLASSADPEVVNTLVVELFQHLHLPEAVLEEFRCRLGPSARALYDRWIAPPGGRFV